MMGKKEERKNREKKGDTSVSICHNKNREVVVVLGDIHMNVFFFYE